MIQVCPFHASADDVQSFVLDGSEWQYTCTRNGHPEPGPYTWHSSASGGDLQGDGEEGIADELGLYGSLVSAVAESRTWVEYGVVEFRFAQQRPDAFGELLEKYGHKHLGPRQYTASSLLGGCLGRLATRGELVYHAGKGTGYWSYNQPSSFYIVNPGPAAQRPPFTHQETYAEFCRSRGEDPDSVAWWPDVWPI
jgi:hypothetical protein